MALMISELVEAIEALRHGGPPSEYIPKIFTLAEGLVDTIIHSGRHYDIPLVFTFRILLSKMGK